MLQFRNAEYKPIQLLFLAHGPLTLHGLAAYKYCVDESCTTSIVSDTWPRVRCSYFFFVSGLLLEYTWNTSLQD